MRPLLQTETLPNKHGHIFLLCSPLCMLVCVLIREYEGSVFVPMPDCINIGSRQENCAMPKTEAICEIQHLSSLRGGSWWMYGNIKPFFSLPLCASIQMIAHAHRAAGEYTPTQGPCGEVLDLAKEEQEAFSDAPGNNKNLSCTKDSSERRQSSRLERRQLHLLLLFVLIPQNMRPFFSQRKELDVNRKHTELPKCHISHSIFCHVTKYSIQCAL